MVSAGEALESRASPLLFSGPSVDKFLRSQSPPSTVSGSPLDDNWESRDRRSRAAGPLIGEGALVIVLLFFLLYGRRICATGWYGSPHEQGSRYITCDWQHLFYEIVRVRQL
jgi:hypothetical protein